MSSSPLQWSQSRLLPEPSQQQLVLAGGQVWWQPWPSPTPPQLSRRRQQSTKGAPVALRSGQASSCGQTRTVRSCTCSPSWRSRLRQRHRQTPLWGKPARWRHWQMLPQVAGWRLALWLRCSAGASCSEPSRALAALRAAASARPAGAARAGLRTPAAPGCRPTTPQAQTPAGLWRPNLRRRLPGRSRRRGVQPARPGPQRSSTWHPPPSSPCSDAAPRRRPQEVAAGALPPRRAAVVASSGHCRWTPRAPR
mmetsp:Transcript_33620/g.100143  ORF Transcript_33620/g.100143 Transcript_33620/m.100143 type:complete len:252 (+) Transcript_33620:195-950(+)